MTIPLASAHFSVSSATFAIEFKKRPPPSIPPTAAAIFKADDLKLERPFSALSSPDLSVSNPNRVINVSRTVAMTGLLLFFFLVCLH